MTCIAGSENIFAVARGLHVDCYNFEIHSYLDVPLKPSLAERRDDDHISDITISSDRKHLALITAISKQLLVCKLPLMKECETTLLPRSASKIRFTANNQQILVADKSGDVLLYDLEDINTGTKLLGHLSLLLDVLQTNDNKYIISSDRDEKIRVSCYPNTYNIQTYCLGHKEFVNHIEMVPHNDKFLTSSSGDGTVKIWNYQDGALCHSINAYLDVDESELKDNFTKAMDEEGVEVTTLPVVHYAITMLDEETSLLAVAMHSYNKVLIYTLRMENNKFRHKKEGSLPVEKFPSAMMFLNTSLVLYNDEDCTVSIILTVKKNNDIIFEMDKTINMFENKINDYDVKLCFDTIKVLYKRKFDNVQEYQERKKQRLEKSIK